MASRRNDDAPSAADIREAAASRSRKGARRRAELIDATMRIIVRDGPQEVTLRNVASEAGHSHGSVAYHFGTRAALMVAAMEHCNDFLVERSRDVCIDIAALPDTEARAQRMTAFYVDSLVRDVQMGTVVLELTIAAAREEYLRPTLYAGGRELQEMFEPTFALLGSTDPGADFQFFLHAVNGVLLAQRSLPRSDFESRVLHPTIRRLFHEIAAGSALKSAR